MDESMISKYEIYGIKLSMHGKAMDQINCQVTQNESNGYYYQFIYVQVLQIQNTIDQYESYDGCGDQ